MDLGLLGKVAIVTGAGRGCGKAYCLGFVEEGVRVVAVDIDREAAEGTAQEIRLKGGKALAFKVDVAKWEDVSMMVNKTIDEFGQIDILVNNAGKRGLALIEEMTEEFFDSEIDVNLKGAVYCTKAVALHMKERRYGKIINQSSSAAITGHPYRGSAYAAAKAGLLGFSRSMARELGSFNINVNAIAPTAVNTEFLAGFSQEAIEANKKRSVFGRIAEAEDLVGLVLFLSSDRSSYITGQTISVDGGQRPT
jgi:NAD(P)-dependent dehydrogenase (short-subunit alcohol dehydrogenase family)